MRRVWVLAFSTLLFAGVVAAPAQADTGSIDRVASTLNGASADLITAQAKLPAIGERIALLEKLIPPWETRLVTLKAAAKARVLQVYKSSRPGQIAYLIQADYRHLRQGLVLSEQLARRDAKLARKLGDALIVLKKEKSTLEAERNDLAQAYDRSQRLQAVVLANDELGKPYQYASRGPDSFDCSGLVTFVYAKMGINLTPYSGAQYDETTRVSRDELIPGDLIFYGPGGSSHVAIYAGEDVMIAAPHTGDVVKLQEIYGEPSGYGRVELPPAPEELVPVAPPVTPEVVQQVLADVVAQVPVDVTQLIPEVPALP